jgi:hypothetical protein
MLFNISLSFAKARHKTKMNFIVRIGLNIFLIIFYISSAFGIKLQATGIQEKGSSFPKMVLC